MLTVRVIRGAGDKKGPDVIDPLISSDLIAILRGQYEINESEPKSEGTLTCLPQSGFRTGMVVSILDTLQGIEWRGKIKALTLNNSVSKARVVLTIKRPTRYYPL